MVVINLFVMNYVSRKLELGLVVVVAMMMIMVESWLEDEFVVVVVDERYGNDYQFEFDL